MNDCIIRAAGSPRECGVMVGRRLRSRLADDIGRYIAAVPGKDGVLNVDELRKGALPWFRRLPRRFVEEFEGIAEGAGLDLQVIAEWEYVEMCIRHGCTSLFCRLDGNVWVGRNNDAPVPDMWGYVMIKVIDGRIPAMGFCIEGSPFMPAGVNRARHDRRPFVGDWTAANNRTVGEGPPPDPAHEHIPRSRDRTCRVDELMAAFYSTGGPELPRDLVSILADDGVERRDVDFASGYSNVACPATGEMWYTLDGYPSASAGNWQRLDWPWGSDRCAERVQGRRAP